MTILTGGCQCGAIRFSCDAGKVSSVSICHCRMCQKAVGNYFAPFVAFESGGVTWTRGERKIYRSSNHVLRAFCADCGTPLTYEADGFEPSIAAGALDDPAALPPTVQYGVEAELPFTASLPSLKRVRTDEGFEGAEFLNDVISNQHPDHDTAVWPLPKA
ncbi:GFA family protein [Pleomorphomonas sp. JP5]|uniref:GFA family protein n=1 Tax=Pleomorphomonas sp. JP5 TaxID=2942998 RepID=UPI0020434FE1|nr:GFA family protein [Pleomorphomonas sp. JP5]MCM5558352.1 GFA family protein [Pleomorphomonas sp. JP5]